MKNFTFISSIFVTLALGTVTQTNAAAQEIQPAHESQTAAMAAQKC